MKYRELFVSVILSAFYRCALSHTLVHHAHTHTDRHILMHTYILTHTLMPHAHTHTETHSCLMHTHILTHTLMHTHSLAHTHTHTHTLLVG